MVSPGTLRVLCDFRDADRDAFEPVVGERGEVTYPAVDEGLDARDDDPGAVLESLADRGVLDREFDAKVYCCPDCDAVGMQFTTACPDCGAVHATLERALVHPACGDELGLAEELAADSPTAEPSGSADADSDATIESDGGDVEANRSDGDVDSDRSDDGEPDRGDGVSAAVDETGVAASVDGSDSDERETGREGPQGGYCSTCDETVERPDLRAVERYRCHDCEGRFDDPAHRLWCRECGAVHAPAAAIEVPLYRYPLTRAGTQWIDRQESARRSLADALDARGYDVSVDHAVAVADGDPVAVHVHATDDLLDHRLVADVHESPTPADVRRLLEAARGVDARPVVALTGAVPPATADVLGREGVTTLDATDDDLARIQDLDDPVEDSTSLLDRVFAVFEPQSPRGRP